MSMQMMENAGGSVVDLRQTSGSFTLWKERRHRGVHLSVSSFDRSPMGIDFIHLCLFDNLT